MGSPGHPGVVPSALVKREHSVHVKEEEETNPQKLFGMRPKGPLSPGRGDRMTQKATCTVGAGLMAVQLGCRTLSFRKISRAGVLEERHWGEAGH